MRRPDLRLRLLLVLLAAPLGACEDESTPGPGAQIEFAVKPYGQAACDQPNGRLMMRRELRLFANAGYDVERTAAALQRYYRRFGITFYRIRAVETVDTAFIENLDTDRLSAVLQRDFPGVDLSDAGLNALAKSDPAKFARLYKQLMNLEFGGALDFFARFGGTGQGVTNVVLLKDLFTPGSPQMLREKVLGISISPILLRELKKAGMDETGAFSVIDFPTDFTPVVFISDPNVKWLEDRAGAVHRDLVLGHEFGHSTGLVHRMDKTNLMNPSTDGTDGCDQQITDDQIAVMREGLGITAPVLGRTLGAQPVPDLGRDLPPGLPSLVAGALRGDAEAQRALLAPLHD